MQRLTRVYGVVLAISGVLMTGTTIAQVKAGTGSGSKATTRLPIRRVILYKNGVGYFEHLGRVVGNQTVSIDFTSAQLNDALKSLTTLDLGGGRIAGVSYNSQAPLARQLDSLQLPLSEKTTRATLFEALRGARVSIHGRGGTTITGRILSFERRGREHGGGASGASAAAGSGATAAAASSLDLDQLVIVGDDGTVHTTNLDPTVSVSLADADLRKQVGSYLDLVSAARAPDLRRMVISTAGENERPLFVSYISEVPVWKTTYRIVLPSAADRKPLLQGWAIIDNTIGEDWTDVELSLVAGAPQSFIQQLSQPYYGSRPVVPLPSGVSTTPQTHQAALRTIPAGFGSVAGVVKDETGAPLPGAVVQVTNAKGDVQLKMTTDEDGRYSMAKVPTGRYRVLVFLAGFAPFGQEVEIDPDAEAVVDAKLAVGAPFETISVSTAMARTADAMEAGVAAAASGRELGDLFEYHLTERVTIRKNESALVPIVSSDIGVEKVSLWHESEDHPRPLRALWITNRSGLTLDGGSFMVIEGEAFAGEGLMDSMKPAERRLISYASDLGVLVSKNDDSTSQRATRIHIDRGVITRYTEERSRTTYTARNEDTTPRDIIVEHPINDGWTLVSSPRPVETTADAERFRLHADPKSTVTLSIEEVHPIESRTMVSSLDDKQVALILTGQPLSPATQQALQTIRARKAELATMTLAQKGRDNEMTSIGKDQERVRENLKALQAASADKSLIARYTRQLATQEDRLEVLRRESADAQAQQKTRQAELESLIQALSVDVTVTPAVAG